MNYKKKYYIHFGSNKFRKHKFNPIINHSYKPQGGLWACPVYSKRSWAEYLIRSLVLSNRKDRKSIRRKLRKHFIFSLKEDTKVLHIDSKMETQFLPRIDDLEKWYDFEKLAKHYDAMQLHFTYNPHILIEGNEEIVFNELSKEMPHWDVDTLLVFNPNAIEVVN